MTKPVIITVAITGAIPRKKDSFFIMKKFISNITQNSIPISNLFNENFNLKD